MENTLFGANCKNIYDIKGSKHNRVYKGSMMKD
jgi:hypothetical protein